MTTNDASLLHVAIQDLYAAKRLQIERLPRLGEAAGEALATLIRAETDRAAAQARRLEATGIAMSGPENLWMAGVLDDADRDAETHERGRLRDVALVGALRKGKAAEIVSNETALALAAKLGETTIHDAVRANRDEEIRTDRALHALLADLTR